MRNSSACARSAETAYSTDTWAVIFDPKYLAKVKGRVTVLDSSAELFAAAFKYLGYSANDVDEKHWREAADLINKGMDGAIGAKTVTYDFARLMSGAKQVSCSGFGQAMIAQM